MALFSKKHFHIILLGFLIFLLSFFQASTIADKETELIVVFKKNISSVAANIIKKSGGMIAKNLKLDGRKIFLIKVGQNKEKDFIRQLKRADIIKSVDKNKKIRSKWIPNDPFYSQGALTAEQWNLTRINLAGAWDKTKGLNATVAVLDTGLAKNLADINYNNVLRGYNYVANNSNTFDDNGHGSHITSLIAAQTNNNIGIVGIAPKAHILPVKILNSNGEGSQLELMQGLIFAYKKGADIINMSLDLESSSRSLKIILDDLARDGVVLVGAAGNNAKASVSYPAVYDSVIAVGATDYLNNKTSYSSYGRGLDLMAPGGNSEQDINGDGSPDGILAETINGEISFNQASDYYFLDGTSIATAHVSGVAALLFSQGVRGFKHIKSALTRTATDLGSVGYDNSYGYGLVNAAAAINIEKSHLSLKISKSRVRYRQKVKVYGTLLPRRRATIYIKEYNDVFEKWHTIAKTRSSHQGIYKKNIRLQRNSYIKADWRGSNTTIGQTSNEKAIRVKAFLSLKSSTKQTVRRSRIILSGKVKPRHTRKIIAIQIRLGKRWKTISRTRLNRHSLYKKPIILNSKKTYRIRAYMRDANHLPSASETISVRIR